MKVRLTIEETLKYQEEIIVEQPDTMSDGEFEGILVKAERESREYGVEDLAFVLSEKYGLKIVDSSKNFPDSPRDNELEIIDVSNVKE
jgi:hypothetical protein